MAVAFADLVLRAQPRLMNVKFRGTEGMDWGIRLRPRIGGQTIDWTGVDFDCHVLTGVGGSSVAEWDITGDADGWLEGVLPDAEAAGLALAFNPRILTWYCEGSLAGAKAMIWGPSMSPFNIVQGV